MEPLHNSYLSFVKNQLPVILKRTEGCDIKAGMNFMDFILQVLPNVIISEKQVPLLDGTDPMDIPIKLWDNQAPWWAHEESFANYFICMSLIVKWLKSSGSVKDILSVGCGPGLYELFIERTFSNMVSSVTCTDAAPKMIEEALNNQRRYQEKYHLVSNAKFQVCRVESLPFADASADAVICNKVLHWCFMKRDALMELHRVLKPGGLMIIISPNKTAAIQTKAMGTVSLGVRIDPVNVGAFLKNMSYELGDYRRIEFPKPFGQGGGSIDDFAVVWKKTK